MPNTESPPPQGYSLKHLVESYGFGIRVLCLQEGIFPITILTEVDENKYWVRSDSWREFSILKECPETNDYYVCPEFLKVWHPNGNI